MGSTKVNGGRLENQACALFIILPGKWRLCFLQLTRVQLNVYLAFILHTMWWTEQEPYLPIGALLWSLIHQFRGSCTSLEYKHCLPECSLYKVVQYFTDRSIDEAVHSDGLNFCRIASSCVITATFIYLFVHLYFTALRCQNKEFLFD